MEPKEDRKNYKNIYNHTNENFNVVVCVFVNIISSELVFHFSLMCRNFKMCYIFIKLLVYINSLMG